MRLSGQGVQLELQEQHPVSRPHDTLSWFSQSLRLEKMSHDHFLLIPPTFLLDKPIVAQLVYKFSVLHRTPKGSLLSPQDVATGSYPEPDESYPHPISVPSQYVYINSWDLRL
jgi:hypothetical protein